MGTTLVGEQSHHSRETDRRFLRDLGNTVGLTLNQKLDVTRQVEVVKQSSFALRGGVWGGSLSRKLSTGLVLRTGARQSYATPKSCWARQLAGSYSGERNQQAQEGAGIARVWNQARSVRGWGRVSAP